MACKSHGATSYSPSSTSENTKTQGAQAQATTLTDLLLSCKQEVPPWRRQLRAAPDKHHGQE